MSEELVKAMADMREEDALKLAREMVASGVDPTKIIGAARQAMDIVGQRYEEGEYFLPELVMAGEMLTQITAIIKPELAQLPEAEHQGKVLIGTVAGDIHDIGKNIVTFMLDVNGFEVLDLGIDVAPEKFVEAVEEFKPQVVGLSGFLTLAFDAMKDTVAAIEAAGLRDGVKIVVGGGQVTAQIAEYAGADAYGDDAMAAVNLAKKWIGG
ncbi:MAG: cobalamin-dependent protein [Anaerolineae bacterium]|jgi:5-methyltetrahydrofolate--homocysteine methyltransferase